MKKILFFFLLFASHFASGQDTWNVCGTTVQQYPAPSYDSTFVLEAPSRDALAKGMANWVPTSGASYKVYTALLTQSGTDAPVATVLENTLGGTVVWTRDFAGVYSGTLSNAFPASKTLVPYSTDGQSFCQMILNDDYSFTGKAYCISRVSDSVIRFSTVASDGSTADEIYENAIYPIHIIVYN